MQPHDPRVRTSGQALMDMNVDCCIALDIALVREACLAAGHSLRVMDSGCIAIPVSIDIYKCAICIVRINRHTGFAVIIWHRQWRLFEPQGGKRIEQKVSDIVTKWSGAEKVVKAIKTVVSGTKCGRFRCPNLDNKCKVVHPPGTTLCTRCANSIGYNIHESRQKKRTGYAKYHLLPCARRTHA